MSIELIDEAQIQWMRTKRFTQNAETNAKIRGKVLEYVAEGDVPSVSHFERAYLVLLSRGEIEPFSDPLGEPAAAATAAAARQPLTADEWNKMLSSESRRRYDSDPQFRADVDRLIAIGAI